MDAETIAKGLMSAQRRAVIVADDPATATVLAVRHAHWTSHKFGHFARRSPLFAKLARKANHVAVWGLSPLGLAVRAALLKDPNA